MIKLGDDEVDLMCSKDAEGNSTTSPLFRLYMQTKLPNPHYIPELQAQSTLINFTVTDRGLEDQLLARTVNKERPDLEEQRIELVEQQNEFAIRLKQLEDDLLQRLANAEGDILADEDLIISLEETKATVSEINEKKQVAIATTKMVEEAREAYRHVAKRGSLVYFLIDQLTVIDHMYQYSLSAFTFMYPRWASNPTPHGWHARSLHLPVTPPLSSRSSVLRSPPPPPPAASKRLSTRPSPPRGCASVARTSSRASRSRPSPT